jgi:hypothetical protein
METVVCAFGESYIIRGNMTYNACLLACIVCCCVSPHTNPRTGVHILVTDSHYTYTTQEISTATFVKSLSIMYHHIQIQEQVYIIILFNIDSHYTYTTQEISTATFVKSLSIMSLCKDACPNLHTTAGLCGSPLQIPFNKLYQGYTLGFPCLSHVVSIVSDELPKLCACAYSVYQLSPRPPQRAY